MSMADDNRLRAQRSNERRGGRSPDDSSGDPLAELARLIGQSDPFSDYGRRDGRDSAPRNTQAPSSDWRRTAASMPPYDSPEPPRAASRGSLIRIRARNRTEIRIGRIPIEWPRKSAILGMIPAVTTDRVNIGASRNSPMMSIIRAR